jgi:hypothetical protein
MKDEYDEEDKEAEIYEKYNLGNEGDDEDNRGSRGSKKAESGFKNPTCDKASQCGVNRLLRNLMEDSIFEATVLAVMK